MRINNLNTVDKPITLTSVNLDRLINLLHLGFKSSDSNPHIVFPFSDIISERTEIYQLDVEDVEYLRNKYKAKYKLELESKLEKLKYED
jgi:hypothetical protein